MVLTKIEAKKKKKFNKIICYRFIMDSKLSPSDDFQKLFQCAISTYADEIMCTKSAFKKQHTPLESSLF